LLKNGYRPRFLACPHRRPLLIQAANLESHPIQPIQLLSGRTLTLVERVHRRPLDVIKDEFDQRGRGDVNAVQALLLYNIAMISPTRS
jgi:hypothetical protein